MPISSPAPDPNVLFYKRTREDGRVEIATMTTIEENKEQEAWRGRFMVPGQAPFFMDQYSSELSAWDPVYALTQDDIEGLVERVSQRVVEIMTLGSSSPSDIVMAGMSILNSSTVSEAVEKAVEVTTSPEEFDCGHCSKTYKYEKSYKKHLLSAHGIE